MSHGWSHSYNELREITSLSLSLSLSLSFFRLVCSIITNRTFQINPCKEFFDCFKVLFSFPFNQMWKSKVFRGSKRRWPFFSPNFWISFFRLIIKMIIFWHRMKRRYSRFNYGLTFPLLSPPFVVPFCSFLFIDCEVRCYADEIKIFS